MDQGELFITAGKFLDRVREMGVTVAGAFLHGPCLSDPAKAETDIHLIVLSGDFGKDLLAESRLLLRAAWDTDPRIVPTAATPEAWADADNHPSLFWLKPEAVAVPLG